MTIWLGAEWLGLEERETERKVGIRDLEEGCSEISRRTASSKDEVKNIACLVSWWGLRKREVKRGEEGKRELESNESKEDVGRLKLPSTKSR